MFYLVRGLTTVLLLATIAEWQGNYILAATPDRPLCSRGL